MAPPDLRTLLRQTETALERSRSDADALRLDLSQLRDTGAQLALEYARLSNGCRQTEIRTQVAADALNAIEDRLGLLEAVRDLSNSTGGRLSSLNQLAEEVMGRAARFQAQKESLDHGLVEVELVADLLAALEARAAKLTEKNELLAHAEDAVVHLERRAAEVTADLERRLNDFEARTHTIARSLDEAARVTDVVAALDARMATLTGSDQGLAYVEEALVHLEQRAAEVTADLERRLDDFDAQRRTIEQALDEAARASDVVTALDARVAMLTGSDQRLAYAEERAGHLEWGAAETTGHLEDGARANGELLKHERTSFQKALRTLSEWAWNTVAMLATYRQRPNGGQSNPASASQRVAAPETAATSGRAQKRQPVQRWAAGLAALALYIALLGLVVTGARNQPVQVVGAARAIARESPASASASALPSRTLGIATFSVLMNLPSRTVTRMPANDAASDARSRQRQHDRRGEQPARPRQDRPSKDLVRPSAVLDAAAVRSGVSPAQTRTTEPSRTTGPARATVPQFTGVLEIESVPAGAAVFINQQHVGETPVLTRFRAGSHAVRIEREGYERWTAAVFVPADKQTRVSAELHSSPGR